MHYAINILPLKMEFYINQLINQVGLGGNPAYKQLTGFIFPLKISNIIKTFNDLVQVWYKGIEDKPSLGTKVVEYIVKGYNLVGFVNNVHNNPKWGYN
jgi:hypothetical protein